VICYAKVPVKNVSLPRDYVVHTDVGAHSVTVVQFEAGCASVPSSACGLSVDEARVVADESGAFHAQVVSEEIALVLDISEIGVLLMNSPSCGGAGERPYGAQRKRSREQHGDETADHGVRQFRTRFARSAKERKIRTLGPIAQTRTTDTRRQNGDLGDAQEDHVGRHRDE
jgi:hypothetical protein